VLVAARCMQCADAVNARVCCAVPTCASLNTHAAVHTKLHGCLQTFLANHDTDSTQKHWWVRRVGLLHATKRHAACAALARALALSCCLPTA
jgi:hypothetical protein